jgi:hypothetical protein
MAKVRKYLYQHEAKKLGLEVKEDLLNRNQNRYFVTKEEWQKLEQERKENDNRTFIATLRKLDKNGDVSSTVEKFQAQPLEVPDNFEIIKISTSESTGQQWVQYAAPKILENTFDEEFVADIVKKYAVALFDKTIRKRKNLKNDFDVLTYTDVHIGMDTDKYHNTMYHNPWNEDVLMQQAKEMIESVLSYQKSNTLVIDDLGDLLDGYEGKTTRKGHDLPQNMTDNECFDAALRFKIYVVDNLAKKYTNIIINNICNDNHSGSFGYFVNSAFKQMAEVRYKNVKVMNHRKFINHYFVKDICFVLTHGKDDKSLRFGFKVFPDAGAIEKIDQYCKRNGIYKKAKMVIFKKGDSHQALFDLCSSDDFFYFNYPAFSPSSNWIKNNFKMGRSGYVLETYKKTEFDFKPCFFKNTA